jgi:hypothetical protein
LFYFIFVSRWISGSGNWKALFLNNAGELVYLGFHTFFSFGYFYTLSLSIPENGLGFY